MCGLITTITYSTTFNFQADYLRNGTTKKVMNMSKSDQTQLWDGLWSSKDTLHDGQIIERSLGGSLLTLFTFPCFQIATICFGE